jgi:RNA-directed DNA polymerase
VRRLQARLVTAGQAGRWGQVRALQPLLTPSCSGNALAVRRGTENAGKQTPGVDGRLWDTPAKNSRAWEERRQRGDRAQPLRRIYLPQLRRTNRWRPLAIPTMQERALQALSLRALDPLAETLGDPNAYGFRQERAPMAALEPGCNVGVRQHAPQGILAGAMRACCDALSPDWFVAHSPMERAIRQTWRQAGGMDKQIRSPTDTGVPQGGIVSPAIAHLALDGRAQVVQP